MRPASRRSQTASRFGTRGCSPVDEIRHGVGWRALLERFNARAMLFDEFFNSYSPSAGHLGATALSGRHRSTRRSQPFGGRPCLDVGGSRETFSDVVPAARLSRREFGEELLATATERIWGAHMRVNVTRASVEEGRDEDCLLLLLRRSV